MIPKFAADLLKQKHSFTDEDIKLIDSNWFFYANQGFRWGDASARAIVREASIVLACAKEHDLSTDLVN
jgi:hypothetical protein